MLIIMGRNQKER